MSNKEFVVYDSEEACPYLPGMAARMPLRRPNDLLTPAEFDQRLAAGDRRTGGFLYNTQCSECRACEPIRLPIADFQMSRTQRRTWKRGCQRLHWKSGPARVDSQRVELFNRHRQDRNLATDNAEIDGFGYEHFLVQTCCSTSEVRYYTDEEQLVAVAICDQGLRSMSAVYTYFEPQYTAVSLGVFSILNQVEICRDNGWEHLYLGYFISDSRHMRYKADYRPHERRIQGRWVQFEREAADY